jgi:hypothetical protein
LARYLDGETTLADFDAWFVPATWSVSRDEHPNAYDLTNEIYLALAEYANGHLTESELKQRLHPLVEAPAAIRRRRLAGTAPVGASLTDARERPPTPSARHHRMT